MAKKDDNKSLIRIGILASVAIIIIVLIVRYFLR
ncbi:Uncharacterised protein [uncultured archaeon]|nr:Uncharacterised protein [uncultured archaeon]